jgi:hypothetical protein
MVAATATASCWFFNTGRSTHSTLGPWDPWDLGTKKKAGEKPACLMNCPVTRDPVTR